VGRCGPGGILQQSDAARRQRAQERDRIDDGHRIFRDAQAVED